MLILLNSFQQAIIVTHKGFFMAEMRKLKVVVLEDDLDAVLRFLGEANIAHFVDMREKKEEWEETLAPNVVPADAIAKCNDLVSKIDALLDHLRSIPRARDEKLTLGDTSAPKEPTEEVLAKVERELADMPQTRIEAFAKCPPLIAIIDKFTGALKFEQEEARIEDNILQKPAEALVADVEDEVFELTQTAESLGLIEASVFDFGIESSSFIERIKKHAKKRDAEFGRELAEHGRAYMEVGRNVARRLSRLRKIVEQVKESIEAETKPERLRQDLLRLRMTVDRERQIAMMEDEFVRSAKTIYFEAWVPLDHVKEAVEKIKQATDETSIVTEEAPTAEEKAPVVLKPVRSYLAAFEKLVYAFGCPSGGDVNPIHVLAITFPILFGIMFADVGQGAIFIIVGGILTLVKRKVKLQNLSDILGYLLISSEMFILLGISAIFFGFIFGEFFGPSEVLHPILLARLGPFSIGGFEPMHEPMKMLKFAILVGVIHINIGLILKFINEIRHKHHKLAPVPLFWMWLILGGVFMWAYWGGISNIAKWFADGAFMLLGLIITPLILIIAVTGLAEGFTGGVGFGVEVFAETLSHSMSYSRLMALGLVHSAMNYLFLVLGGVEHGYFPLQGIPIIAVGTLLVMIIEGLVVFVHTLRLHWVEWFSKFHTGEGIPFKPLKFNT